MGLVVDSGVFILAERKDLAVLALVRQIDKLYGVQPLAISAITITELSHGMYRSRIPGRAKFRLTYLKDVESAVSVTDLDLGLARLVGRIQGEQAARGVNIPLADLIIGTTAVWLGYGILTTNPKHFSLIPNLTVHTFNP